MAVDYIHNSEVAILFCTSTGVAFGPVISLPKEVEHCFSDVEEFVQYFLDWLPQDARKFSSEDLVLQINAFTEYSKGRA